MSANTLALPRSTLSGQEEARRKSKKVEELIYYMDIGCKIRHHGLHTGAKFKPAFALPFFVPLRTPQGGIEVNVLRDLKGTLTAEAVVARLWV